MYYIHWFSQPKRLNVLGRERVHLSSQSRTALMVFSSSPCQTLVDRQRESRINSWSLRRKAGPTQAYSAGKAGVGKKGRERFWDGTAYLGLKGGEGWKQEPLLAFQLGEETPASLATTQHPRSDHCGGVPTCCAVQETGTRHTILTPTRLQTQLQTSLLLPHAILKPPSSPPPCTPPLPPAKRPAKLQDL